MILDTVGHIREPHVESERPNIFELYEQNIGLLQPLLAEELEEAEATYPPGWILEAFKIAVEHNVRHWRYIRSILERWDREGRDDSEKPRFDRNNRSGRTWRKRA